MSEENKDTKSAADEGKALAKLKAELAAEKKMAEDSKAELQLVREALAKAEGELKAQADHIDTLKGVLEHFKSQPASGGGMLTSAAEVREAEKAQRAKSKLHQMREQAMQIAGPNAQHVKYIVGPSGTVREGLGVVKAGKVIDVPVDELPSGEWKVWTPDGVQSPAAPAQPDTAAAIQARNRPSGLASAAERALAQREALKSQLREG